MKGTLQGLLIIAVTAAVAPAPAAAQSADLVLCDRIAADPSDPDRPADVKGVADIAASDVATAIKFCKNAANSSRRAMYQLGRAYAAKGQTAEAMAAWRRAAAAGRRMRRPPRPTTNVPPRSAMRMRRRRWSGCAVLTQSRTSAETW